MYYSISACVNEMCKFPSTLTLAHTIWDTKGETKTLIIEMPNTQLNAHLAWETLRQNLAMLIQ